MSIAQLTQTKAQRVIGIDCSTNSLAFAVFEGDTPVTAGEVRFRGQDVFERLNDARKKTQALVDEGILVGDYVSIESAIMVRNVQVAIKLAYVYGAVMGVIMQNKMKVNEVPPITWQSKIGNPNLKKAEKEALKEMYPGKSASWYQNKGREIRKQRTLDIAKQYFSIADNSDNVGDAVGLALYTRQVLTRTTK